MVDPARRLEEVLFVAARPEDVPLESVRAAVARDGVACVRGLFPRDEIRAVLARIADGFDCRQDRKHDPRDTDAVRRNFQKLQIGAGSGVGSRRTLGRFMRVLYNPIFAPDVHGMRAHFVRLARLRNLLYGLPAGFAVEGDEQGLWTCARIQQYPRGGGFMVPHRDMYAQVATTEAGIGYFQLLLLLTEKGRDFQEGGAYVDRGEDRFAFEDGCASGDVVVYDGRSVHGVADIDPLLPLDLTRFSGRAVALASLFRVLTPGERDYAEMGRKAAEWYQAGRET
jgi:hypothetical protein